MLANVIKHEFYDRCIWNSETKPQSHQNDEHLHSDSHQMTFDWFAFALYL